MSAMADASPVLGKFGGNGSGGRTEIRVNGHAVKTVVPPGDPRATDPVLVDLSSSLSTGENRVELIQSGGAQSVLVRLSSGYWLPWKETQARNSSELRLAVHFDPAEARIGEPIRCSVKAERIGFRGYGMMLAEIGLPPGADVDRGSLESLLDDTSLGLDRYEVLPDRVVLYLWPKAGGASFNFVLRARMPMTAKSAPSTLYDYYNPEALSEVAPVRWVVK
jgi:hypothetical protein